MDGLSNSVALPAASTPLVGLRVNVADSCICSSRKAVIGSDHVMQCVACGVSRGSIGPRTTKFITEIISKFGRPTEPIELRRADVCVPYVRAALDVTDEAGRNAILAGRRSLVSADTESLAAHFRRATKKERIEAAREIGVSALWDEMLDPLLA